MANKLAYGINLDCHPQASVGRPQQATVLGGVQWVRLVFKFHAAVDLTNQAIHLFGYDFSHVLEYEASLARAFAHFDALIDAYAQEGVHTLLILNQETFAGNAPWMGQGSHEAWERFGSDFATVCGKVAAHYRGKGLAYEIWNEGDIVGAASIHVPAEHFAPILGRTSKAIKEQDPGSQVIFGGLASGPEHAIQYVKDVRQALGGVLPVDAIGIHPYLQKLRSEKPPFTKDWPGFLDQTLDAYISGLPGEKFWITEIGIAPDTPLIRELWDDVAQFMEGVFELVRSDYAESVPTIVWFAWSDLMHEAGIVDRDGNPKQPIFDTFFRIVRVSLPELPEPITPESSSVDEEQVFLVPVDGAIRIRHEPMIEDGNVVGSAEMGTRLEALDPAAARESVGHEDEWAHVRLEGWSAAWLLSQTTEGTYTPTQNINVRKEPVMQEGNIVGDAKMGARLEALDPAAAQLSVGHENEWIHVRLEGWSAAWLLSLASSESIIPQRIDSGIVPDPSNLLAGQRRAFDFDHEPIFVCLPVKDATQIESFSGFGPNNFSYRTFLEDPVNGGVYKNLGGLHNGLDFGVPTGTMLCAVDWGVVVHVSSREDDNPFRAGPFTVIVRYGSYLAVYGHMNSVEGMRVQVGQIVKPGDDIGLSGIGNNFEHLHFEMRNISTAHVNKLRQQAMAQGAADIAAHMSSVFNLGSAIVPDYINPARFFVPPLPISGWPLAQSLQGIDSDKNGYPDRVVRAGEAEPVAYNLQSLDSFPRSIQQHFWQGSNRV